MVLILELSIESKLITEAVYKKIFNFSISNVTVFQWVYKKSY